MDINEIRKAADRGPIYLLLFVGGALSVGVDSTEFAIDPSHALSVSAFITVNVIGAVLIIVAGVLSLLLTRATLRTLEATSQASALQAERAQEMASQASTNNTKVQSEVNDKAAEVLKIAMGGGMSSSSKQ